MMLPPHTDWTPFRLSRRATHFLRRVSRDRFDLHDAIFQVPGIIVYADSATQGTLSNCSLDALARWLSPLDPSCLLHSQYLRPRSWLFDTSESSLIEVHLMRPKAKEVYENATCWSFSRYHPSRPVHWERCRRYHGKEMATQII